MKNGVEVPRHMIVNRPGDGNSDTDGKESIIHIARYM